MCGIAGIWTRGEGPVDAASLVTLRDAMRARGPDDAGLLVDGDVGLAHRRLSIVDLSAAGRQPLANEDGRVQVVFNGEIYNHATLREALERAGHRFRSATDGEVLAHGYEAWGLDLLDHLNGMFAFALWDGARRRLVLARDRLGVKPLYYLQLGRTIAFASEVKALAAAFPGALSIDWSAIDAYLHFGFVPQEMGVYREIRALAPAHVLDVRETSLDERRYWDLPFEPRPAGGRSAWGRAVRGVLDRATARRLAADVPVGVLLSGGVDSSLVTALACHLGAEPEAFTIAFDAGADTASDVNAARTVARHLGVPHRVRVLGAEALEPLDALVWGFGVPFADSSAIPTYHAGRLAADHGIKVVLTGDGGDEVFGGYSNAQAAYLGALCRSVVGRLPGGRRVLFRTAALGRRLPLRPRVLHRLGTVLRHATGDLRAALCWTDGWHGDGLHAVRGPALRDAVGDGGHEDGLLLAHACAAHGTVAERVLQADLKLILPGDYLVKIDVALMASSVEGRSPFLDVETMELGARIPLGVKLSPFRSKNLLKRVALDVGLPVGPLFRPKHGFSAPVGAWLRGPLRGRARDCLFGTLPSRGVIDVGVVRRVWDAHMAGAENHATRLWILLCLELWFRTFVDGAEPAAVRSSA